MKSHPVDACSKEEISIDSQNGPWESSASRHLFIISITAGGGRLRGGRSLVEAHPSSAYVYTRFPYVTYLHFTRRKRKRLFSHPRLSPALLNYVCHPSPRICCSNISVIQPVYTLPTPLFIATRLSNPVSLRKRSWMIISRLSTRDIARICLVEKFSTSLCWRGRPRSFVRFNFNCLFNPSQSIYLFGNGWRCIHIFVDIYVSYVQIEVQIFKE